MGNSKIVKMLHGVVPRIARDFMAEILGHAALSEKISQLEERLTSVAQKVDDVKLYLPEFEGALYETSRIRWREVQPDNWLTWGKYVNGDNFIRKVNSYNAFNPGSAILEVGPGYGRLIKSLISHNIAFKSYLGVDISSECVAFLKENFKEDNISFVNGDIESIVLNEGFDVVISSLTFKHLYPSFEKALLNITHYLNSNGRLFFDLIEGEKKYFETEWVTYIRQYTREEINEILQSCALKLDAFDEVEHDKDHRRLLVVARKL